MTDRLIAESTITCPACGYANAETLSSSGWGLYLVSAAGGLMLFGGAFV